MNGQLHIASNLQKKLVDEARYSMKLIFSPEKTYSRPMGGDQGDPLYSPLYDNIMRIAYRTYIHYLTNTMA